MDLRLTANTDCLNSSAVTSEIDDLLRLSQAGLDDLFHNSLPGEIPDGRARGTLLLGRGHRVSGAAAGLVHALAWRGKEFDAQLSEIYNTVTPLNLPAVVAEIYKGPSWFDAAECIVLDYRDTSLLAHWIRNEIREISPGTYLGLAYWGNTRLLHFALQFSTARPSSLRRFPATATGTARPTIKPAVRRPEPRNVRERR